MRIRTAVVGLAFLTAGALSAQAQVVEQSFQIVASGGWHTYSGGSGLKGGPSLGGEATYYLTPSIGVGIYTDLTFAEVDGKMFPVAALSYVDSTTLHYINQGVDVWTYGVHGKLQLMSGRAIQPFALGGVGGYTVFLDPQQNDRNEDFSRFMLRLGVGADFAMSETLGFHVSVTDNFFPSWRAQRLYAVREDYENTRFAELNPDPGELKDSVHNIKFVVGVTVVPGR